MPLTPDPYEIENAPDAGQGIEGSEQHPNKGSDSTMSLDPKTEQAYAEFVAFLEQDLRDSEVDWISYENTEQAYELGYSIEHRQVDGLFGCGNVAITVEARVDGVGTIPFVAVRTDSEAFLDVDGIDRLIAALAWARQDLQRVQGDLK